MTTEVESLREEVESLRRRLAATTMPTAADAPTVLAVPPLAANADSDTAFAYLHGALGNDDTSVPALAALLRLLRANASYAQLGLPADDTTLGEYACRMHALADVNFDGQLSRDEFSLFWRNLPTSTVQATLSESYTGRMVAPAASFVFGSREDWVGGLQRKLGRGVTRSVEDECQLNDNGAWADDYAYITQRRAEAAPTGEHDAHGHPIIFDEGHDGMSLADFRQLAIQRGAQLHLVEVAVLRMYSSSFYVPWSAWSFPAHSQTLHACLCLAP